MSNTMKRIIGGAILAAIILVVALLEYLGVPAVRWTAVIIAVGMIIEMMLAIARASDGTIRKGWNLFIFTGFWLWLLVVLLAAYFVGARPGIFLLLLMIICGADIGAWFFGNTLGGDKMWERLSPHKTWAGQIAGIICGTLMSVLYSKIFAQSLVGAIWFGVGVSLLSQYGDLTASWIKRRLGLKDFGNIIPGHGGFLDRFDGWIYALPLVWLTLM